MCEHHNLFSNSKELAARQRAGRGAGARPSSTCMNFPGRMRPSGPKLRCLQPAGTPLGLDRFVLSERSKSIACSPYPFRMRIHRLSSCNNFQLPFCLENTAYKHSSEIICHETSASEKLPQLRLQSMLSRRRLLRRGLYTTAGLALSK